MAPSEIDDIFAAKKSVAKVIAQPTASTSTSTDATGSKKKKKDKKRKRQTGDVQDSGINEEKAQKRRLVETVHDPSTKIPSASSSKKVIKRGRGIDAANQKVFRGKKEDLDRFKDSRGTGPRRKTEEGFLVFKEAELGISPEAGGTSSPTSPQCRTDPCPGTPLCPFDCDCCF